MKENVRKQGILLPVSSIPSAYGIGTFGRESYRFVDFLEKSGNRLWQILPLGPTGYGDSPYQSFSTFAGNPYYIDLEILIEEGLLTKEICDGYDFGDNEHYVDYEKIYLSRFKVLKIAFENAKKQGLMDAPEYQKFITDNAYWLDDYALYMAVKNAFGGVCFMEWDEDIRLRKAAALRKYRKKLSDEIAFYCFQQYLFAKQWKELKTYANKKGIEIVGDIPIYVAFDSADTWANPKLFQLDREGRPIGVAGCPPDCFSETGQLWGNPLYNWPKHTATGYEWWIERIKYQLTLTDFLRIDHFRGFDRYWAVPYGEETAINGEWKPAPGINFFTQLQANLGYDLPIIAEDLGEIDDSVIELRDKFNLPGMKILQFAFENPEENDFLPHNYTRNCVCYTGTHDNDTTLGWYHTIPACDRRFAKNYLNIKGNKKVTWEFIRAAIASVSDTAIIPMQDYLELGSEARINTPSTLGDNWKWRMSAEQLSPELAEEILELCKLYGRVKEK